VYGARANCLQTFHNQFLKPSPHELLLGLLFLLQLFALPEFCSNFSCSVSDITVISVERGWKESCQTLLGDRFVVLSSSKKWKLQLLFLEAAAEDCVYLETPTPKILAVLPAGLSLLSALQDPYHAECVGWRERDGARQEELPRCNSISLSLALVN